jgi:hypothetical protein
MKAMFGRGFLIEGDSMDTCPNCNRKISNDTIICEHCGMWLTENEAYEKLVLNLVDSLSNISGIKSEDGSGDNIITLEYEYDFKFKYPQHDDKYEGYFKRESSDSLPSKEDKVEVARLDVTINRKEIRERICPALERLSNDAFEIARGLIPVFATLHLTQIHFPYLTPLSIATAALIIARMGIAQYCAGKKPPKEKKAKIDI